jgi:hypothetical protein
MYVKYENISVSVCPLICVPEKVPEKQNINPDGDIREHPNFN